MTYVALIPAGGVGRRLKLGYPKQYFPLLGDKTMLEITVERLASCGVFSKIIIAVAPDDAYVAQCRFKENVTVLRVGGATRAQTVRNALFAGDIKDEAWVFVHDAARPCVTTQEVLSMVSAIEAKPAVDGVILGLPITDTVKMIDDKGIISKTIDRRHCYRAQTPQAFRAKLLRNALSSDITNVTDEAGAIERLGGRVKVVLGKPSNIKLTTADDIAPVKDFLKGRPMGYRTGIGYDLHLLVPDRPLILGGVAIAFDKGLLGHSDADVLIHAVIDALLGAAHLGDIGRLFPDTDASLKDADSGKLLQAVVARVKAANFTIENVDTTIIAQAPKLSPHIESIESRLAELLGISIECVSVKAKTNEGVDATGRGEAVAAQAVATLSF